MSESSPYRLGTAWRVVQRPDHVVIEDASGVALAHIFFDPSDKPDRALGQLTRSEALAAAHRMVAAQDAKIAIRRATERIEAGGHELGKTMRKLH